MPQTTVVIPKVGIVAFLSTMDGKAINGTVKTLHQKAVLKSVLKFVAKDPALTGLDTAEFYKQLSSIAAFLGKYTSLARAADAGIHRTAMHDLPTVDEDLHAPVEPAQPEAESQETGDTAEPEPSDEEEQPAKQSDEEPSEQPEEK